MNWRLVFTDQYNRRAARFLGRHPDLINQYTKTLRLLSTNPYHPSLRLHALKGKLFGLHSVSINLRQRITIEMVTAEREIIPVNVGDHDQAF